MKCMAAMLGLVGAGMLAGCSPRTDYTRADQEMTPPPLDEATRLRNFDPTIATFANGDTIAGHTGFVYTPERYRAPWQYYFLDPSVFFVNLATSPYWLATNPGAMRYEGLRFENTYTANPALPMSQSTPTTEPRPTVSPIPLTHDEGSTINETPDPTPDEMTEEPQAPESTGELPAEPATPPEAEPSAQANPGN